MSKLKRAITITISITIKDNKCLWPLVMLNVIQYLPTQFEVIEMAV